MNGSRYHFFSSSGLFSDRPFEAALAGQRAGEGRVIFHSSNFLFSGWALALVLLVQLCQFNTAECLVELTMKSTQREESNR